MANEVTKKETLEAMETLEKIYQDVNIMQDSIISAQEKISQILRQLTKFNKKLDKSSKTYIEVFNLLLPHIEFFDINNTVKVKLKQEVFMKNDNLIYKILDVIGGEEEFKFLKTILEDIMLQRKLFSLKLTQLKCIKEQTKSSIILELLDYIGFLKFDECVVIEFINMIEFEKSKLALKL